MKKILFLTFIVLCTVSSVKAQDIVNLRMDRQQMGLRGNVASMDEDILIRKDYFREDWPERKWFVKDLRNVLSEDNGRIVTFNPAGRMTTITYTHQGKQGKKTTCSYASNGLLSSFLGEGYKVEAKYSGNMADINVFVETKNYQGSVNLAKADLNTAPYTHVYPFDLKCRQELGDDGLVLTSKYYYVDSMPAKICVYNYNHLNLLMSEKIEDYTSGEKEIKTIRYTYDNRGFLTQKVLHSKSLDETTTYVNNEYGDCTKMTIERPYGTVVYTFDYVYDSMENWTVRLQFEDGVFDNAALRTFTYHKESKSDKPDKPKVKAAQSDKEKAAVEKRAEKERVEAEKKAGKEAKAKEREEMKAREKAAKEAEKNMTAEERKVYKEQQKAIAKAEKERKAAEKRAEKERIAAEKKAAKEIAAAEKRAEKERKAAEKQAEKERKAAEKAAKKAAKN